MKVMLPTWIAERIEVQPDGCWHWTRTITEDGYGRAERLNGSPAKMAHRAVYLTLVGAIPDGMQIGHVCHDDDADCPGGPTCLHRRCVNPSHLRPMTNQENAAAGHLLRRATHCRRGHELTGENVYEYGGRRHCRTCRREVHQRAFYRKVGAAYYRKNRRK